MNNNGIDIEFTYLASSTLAEYAAGFPWFVHVLGQSALLKAIDEHPGRTLTVDDKRHIEVWGMDVINTTYDISQNQFAQQFSEEYIRIVRNSPNRETVLRAFACCHARDIPTSEVYRILKSRLGIRSPSVYKAQLASSKYGGVIHTLHGHNSGWVNFANEMFKVYIRLTPSVYEGIGDKVHNAFQNVQFRR